MSKKYKRRKKRRGRDFSVQESTGADGINFYALVAGMVTLLSLILLAWSHWGTPRKIANVLAAANDSNLDAGAINEIDFSDFEQVLARGSASELNNILIAHDESKERNKGVDYQILANRRRIAISNKMLGMALNAKQRELAIVSTFEAMTVIHELNHRHQLEEPSVVESLRKLADAFKNDDIGRVALAARLSVFKLNSIELPAEDIQFVPTLVVDGFIELNQDYQDNRLVIAALRMTTEYYFTSFDHPVGASFVESLRKRVDVSHQPKLAEVLDEFSDIALLLESGMDEAFANRWAHGISGQQELLKLALDLAADPRAGPGVIDSLDNVASWLEQIDQYDFAVQIYREIQGHAKEYQSPKTIALAQQISEYGIRRFQLVGKELMVAGVKPNGDSIAASDYENKVIVVVFWSSDQPNSVAPLRQLVVENKDWRQRPVQIIAVNIVPVVSENLDSIVSAIPGFQVVIPDADRDGENPIFDQCPSTRVPRALLVGTDGIVVDINVPMLELKTQVDFLLQARKTDKD